MSRPLVMLPPAFICAPLMERAQIKRSPDNLESFDLLAHAAAAEEALRLALDRPSGVRALVLAAAAPPADPALVTRFAALKIPTLALFGTRDREAPPQTGRRWRALLPGCHLVFLYDAGHDLAADRPQAFADIVLDFLSDPGAFLVNRRDGSLQRERPPERA